MNDIESKTSRHIIINGLPGNVTPEKRAVFQRHVERKFTELLGHSSFNLFLLTDKVTGLVSGAFMMFATEDAAEAALAKLNLYHLTRSDVITTYRWSALDRAQAPEEDYVPPTMPEEAAGEDDFSHSMAEDAQARPQYLIKGGIALDCEWYSFDWEKGQPVLYRRPDFRKSDSIGRWSEMDRHYKSLRNGLVSSLASAVRPLPVWSSYGTMVISEHESGLRVWGGRTMALLFEIPEDVEAFMVSPREKYIVIKTANDLSVWNLRTARKIRTLGNLDLHTDDLWPIVRFSADDSLVVVCKTGFLPDTPNKVGIGKLNIYGSEKMRVVKGDDPSATSHTFAIAGLYKADWNPSVGTQIAYVSCLDANQGWKVVISDIHFAEEDNVASEEILIQRNFMNAERLDMLWHPAGTHLAVKVTLKKSVEYCFFHITPRNVAAIQLQVKPGHFANRFAWQPGGEYFAIILEKPVVTGGSATAQLAESSVMQIYSIKHNKLKLMYETLTSTTHLLWAPKGTRLVAVNFNKSILHFFHVNNSGIVVDKRKLNNVSGTDARWDPTGRFLATWVSSLRNTTMAPQYRIFDGNGIKLFEKEMKPFSHFAWRPLPPSLLNEQDVLKVKESMKMILEDYNATIQQKKEEEKAKVLKQQQNSETTYVKKMNDLARKMVSQGLQQTREELQNSSKWMKHWKARIQSLPEEERTIHENVEEERLISRREEK